MTNGMDILAAPPFRTGSVTWQEQPGQWTLTVVCKATYALTAGTSPLAAVREDVNEQDNHWDDDPQRSVYAPSDLAPVKPKPEVMLVGSAFAPSGAPARSLFVRIVVGELDKSIEVLGHRSVGSDGMIHDGPRWTKMPLRWERAAGGPDTSNPVGQTGDAIDAYNRRVLPNLQPPGMSIASAGDVIPPVGFGPLAAAWQVRREKLRHRVATWSDERWYEEPLGDDFDPTFFQAAPLDQRVDLLRADEQIVLENLHHAHPRLVTHLPGVRPRAQVEAEDMPPWELTLVADTLWIDTDRGICTLTWRGQIPLDHRDARGIVRIGVEEPGQPVRWPSAADAASAGAAPAGSGGDPGDTSDAREDTVAPGLPRAKGPVLPFQAGADAMPPPEPAAPRAASPSWPRDAMAETHHGATKTHARMPSWLDPEPPRATPASVPPPPGSPFVMPRPPPAPPPPVGALLRRPLGPAPTSVAAASNGAVAPPAPLVPSLSMGQAISLSAPAPSPSIGERAARVNADTGASASDPVLSSGGAGGALEASNAAAAVLEKRDRGEGGAHPSTSPAPPRAIFEVLWHDAARMDRVRENEAWATIFADVAAKAEPPPAADDPKAAEKKAKAERAEIAAVLARAIPIADVESAIAEAASDDGALAAPLVVVSGELELPFDDVKMLDVLLGAAGSLGAGDKRVKEVVDVAGEVMKTPLGASPEVAAGFVLRLRDAWVKSNRMLPADYLDVHARRILLDQRAYQKRVFADEEWIRGLLHTGASEGSAVPAYLPAALARKLPLLSRFPARILAEAVPQQDQYESHPAALEVIALARVLPARARAARS